MSRFGDILHWAGLCLLWGSVVYGVLWWWHIF